MTLATWALLALSLTCVSGLDNGLAVTPPMGFRTWNQFGTNVNQSLMEGVFQAMTSRTRAVDGRAVSLLDLGYTHAGIDDGWQLCNSGPDGKGFHNASGFPLVDTTRFPDVKGMTALASSLGLVPGWYSNNCHCNDHSKTCTAGDACYIGDADATNLYGFGSLKIDGCGAEKNVSEMAALFNASGKRVLLENCHNGVSTRDPQSGEIDCPMHLFRTSADIRPTYGSVISNLLTVDKYNSAGLTGPSCWVSSVTIYLRRQDVPTSVVSLNPSLADSHCLPYALLLGPASAPTGKAYPDMLEVGVTAPQPPGAKHHCETPEVPCQLNSTEWQTHFSAWAINSAPLVLGMDVRDNKAMDAAWYIISNPEVIAINQQWAGDAGRLVEQSTQTTTAPNCGSGNHCELPAWLVYAKTLPVPPAQKGRSKSAAAVLLVNNGPETARVEANLTLVRGLGPCGNGADEVCSARNAPTRSPLPNITGDVLSATLGPHDSLLAVITSPQAAAPPPPPPAPPSPAPPPTPSGDCRWIPGSGLQGGDIAFADSATKEECCGACKATPNCTAACFRPPSHTGPGGKGCHMKSMLKTDPGGRGDADAVVCVPN